MSTFGHRLGWNIRTKRLFGHIVAGCGVGPGPASAAELFVSTEAALAFEAVAITHSCQVLVVAPNIGESDFEYIPAVYGQIAAGEHIALVPHEQHAQARQASSR